MAYSRSDEIIDVGIAFLCLSGVTIIFRLLSRFATRVAIGLDDWLIYAAALTSWAYTALCMVGAAREGYGQHINTLSMDQITTFGKVLYALAIIYPVALTLSKLSLIALYWRLFKVGKKTYPLWILAGLNVAWMLAALIVGIVSCIPIDAQWDPSITDKTCIDYYALFLANEAITMTFDLAVIIIPVYYIKSIQRSRGDRASLSITFLLGLVATVVSALRLWRLIHANTLNQEDVTYAETDAGLWACIELNIWILVASIPALRPLVRQFYQERIKKHTTTSSSYAAGSSQQTSSSGKSWFAKVLSKGSSQGSSQEATDNRSVATETRSVTDGGTPRSHSDDHLDTKEDTKEDTMV